MRLSARMKSAVRLFKPLGADVRVDLGSRDVGMAEQFLDHAQIRTTFEEMRSEGMP